MGFANPATPNLPDYLSFLRGNVGIESVFLPSSSGTASGGSTTTLIDGTQTWTAGQWAGAALYDSTQNFTGNVASNTANTLTLAAPLSSAIAAGDAYTVMEDSVLTTFNVALEIVNPDIATASGQIYTLAVYNLATDRLINYAVDQPGQSFFQDQRKSWSITTFSPGVASSAADQGTSTGILNPEQMRLFTMQDLQTLKTPWGRQYMAFAQMYGRTLWGLS